MVLIACFEVKSINFCYCSHFFGIADGAFSGNVHDQKMILFGQSINAVSGGQPAGHCTGSRLVVAVPAVNGLILTG